MSNGRQPERNAQRLDNLCQSRQHGNITIYSGPKRPKVKEPAYGYKFVQTQRSPKRKRK